MDSHHVHRLATCLFPILFYMYLTHFKMHIHMLFILVVWNQIWKATKGIDFVLIQKQETEGGNKIQNLNNIEIVKPECDLWTFGHVFDMLFCIVNGINLTFRLSVVTDPNKVHLNTTATQWKCYCKQIHKAFQCLYHVHARSFCSNSSPMAHAHVTKL